MGYPASYTSNTATVNFTVEIKRCTLIVSTINDMIAHIGETGIT